MTSNNPYPFSDPTLRQASSMMMANGEWTYCKRCYIYRPPRAHHCHVCRRCILNMDHHCPWINNCVGEYNQKYFMQFTAYCCEYNQCFHFHAVFADAFLPLLLPMFSCDVHLHRNHCIRFACSTRTFPSQIVCSSLRSELDQSPVSFYPS